jgi:hypothetical protein
MLDHFSLQIYLDKCNKDVFQVLTNFVINRGINWHTLEKA